MTTGMTSVWGLIWLVALALTLVWLARSVQRLNRALLQEQTYEVPGPYPGLRTHSPDQCSGEFCSLHNPSAHPLSNAPLNWRSDRTLMERICEHGIGHPDPDHLAHVRRTRGEAAASGESVHGCDFCCSVQR